MHLIITQWRGDGGETTIRFRRERGRDGGGGSHLVLPVVRRYLPTFVWARLATTPSLMHYLSHSFTVSLSFSVQLPVCLTFLLSSPVLPPSSVPIPSLLMDNIVPLRLVFISQMLLAWLTLVTSRCFLTLHADASSPTQVGRESLPLTGHTRALAICRTYQI